MKKLSTNLVLILVSLLVGVLLVEVTLRLFFPKYQYAAESQFDQDPKRIWARKAHSRYFRTHPDTGIKHLVSHNNLALRQHRDFNQEDLNTAVNVGFFGDSSTENLRMSSQFSFTEPLDYLLNLGPLKFNTLNFGVDGYGTDQSFLYYQESPLSKELDYVFYIFSNNDIRNIFENNIFVTNEEGFLVRNPIYDSPWWIQMASKLHFTYLVIDLKQRLLVDRDNHDGQNFEKYFFQKESHRVKLGRDKRFRSERATAIEQDLKAERENEDLQRTITIFRSLLELWKQSVENSGGKFFIVLLPTSRSTTIPQILGPGFQIIDLKDAFKEMIPNFKESDYTFKNDAHWNEQANVFAARHFYRILEQEANLQKLSDDKLQEELFTYYSSFPTDWMPRIGVKKAALPPETLANIRKKYNALEYSHPDSENEK